MEFITVLVTSPSTLLTSKTQTEPAASRCRQHHFSKTPVPGNHSLQTSLKYTNSPYSAGSDTSQQTQHIKLGNAESSVPSASSKPSSQLHSPRAGQLAFCIPITWISFCHFLSSEFLCVNTRPPFPDNLQYWGLFVLWKSIGKLRAKMLIWAVYKRASFIARYSI